ncbi:polymorphic toxin-type HINT domain-containing protein [Amycolatopsis sp. lyj-23]|uniref:polymorphic toxin-type HINT domain-containing protein n=1 Tax=Amycolatopsis sp. lyj-23 TaxID=2789283 RepID=UPI00397826EE
MSDSRTATSGGIPLRKQRRLLRGGLVLTLVAALTMQSAAALADTDPDEPADVSLSPRAKVLMIWRSAGSQVKLAAEQALTGTDADVDAFLTQQVGRLAGVDDRLAVNQILAAGGPTVKAAAQRALDATDTGSLRAFLDTGWSSASDTDLRIRVDQIMAAGGPQVRAAAQKALDAQTPQALKTFLTTTSVRAEATDLRIRVNQIMAAGGPEVKAAAQTALDAETTEALRLFIAREWEVAEARDQETSSVQQLADAAKIAGQQAAEETQAAKDSADTALKEADLARQASELAAAAAEAAKDNAQGAADAANRAADAANRAASAAVTAIGAANAASAAARVAASAATRAAAAAAKAGRASSTAWGFAAAARVDRGKAGDAAKAAIDASAASKSAQDAVTAIDLAKTSLGHARDAINAADSAGQNATKSADAAQQSVKWAKAAGIDASKAEAAAAASRRQANLANRAAASARAYADEAASAADQARTLAQRAATDAALAAAAADDAAQHAVDSARAAELATQHANSASAAAQIAVDSANQAQRIYTAARKADADRTSLQADQATEAAQQALDVQDHLGLTRKWNAAQEVQRDAETNRLLAEAAAPGTDPALAAVDGRKVALRLLTTGGPWTQAAAQTALTGSDAEAREFAKAGVGQAASLDDRETVREQIDDAVPDKKAAGERALAGSDADVKRFLASPDYPSEGNDLRLQVNQVQAAARAESNAVVVAEAQKALDAGTVAAYRQFLDTGQNIAREKDDRIALNQLIANTATGPEARLLAQAALAGSPDIVRQYRLNGQYVAARHDRESAVHNAVVAGLVAQATSVAAKASENAATAQSVAATARKAAAEAADYANRAKGFATDAGTYAEQARQSAQQAQDSAREAARSADAAKQAAARASQSAVKATRSATAARHSANLANSYAQSAMVAAHEAYQDAVDAGKDAQAAVDAANSARDAAISRATQEIDAAKKKFSDDVNKTCESVPAGPDRDDCVARAQRMIADPKGESERNVAVCNQLKQYSEQVFGDCLKGAYDPSLTYKINSAIAEAKQKAQDEADSERWWSIAGTVVAGAVVVGAGIFCAEVCAAPLIGALVGAEAGFLAEAAGAGIGLTIGADFLAGIASDSFLASRLGALSTEEFLSSTAIRNGLANLEQKVAKELADCNSFLPGTQVLMGDGSRRAIEDVAVGETVVATDPDTGTTHPEPVTDRIASGGLKHLVDIRLHGTVLTATGHHPFWVTNRHAWVNADSLATGDLLRQPDGSTVAVDGVSERTEEQRVRNLTVDELHSYYVVVDGVPVLVHNSTCIALGTSLGVAELANPLVDSLKLSGKLPSNYVTKAVAEAAGWKAGKALNNFIPGAQIGGDVFRNVPALVPEAPGRIWYEADVGLDSAMTRAKQPGYRLLYSNDGLAYVTFDHYELGSFYRLPNWK